MSEQLKESLSAVMDGEADEFEIRRVLNEAANDPEFAWRVGSDSISCVA